MKVCQKYDIFNPAMEMISKMYRTNIKQIRLTQKIPLEITYDLITYKTEDR